MGIPSYFRQIAEKYPNIIIELGSKQCFVKPSQLFLDFNCLIHPCVQNVLSKYHDKKQLPVEKLEELFCQEIERYLFYVLDKAMPNKLLYIAIDGVAPRAKMTQQRKRRFRSVKEKATIRQIKNKLKT